jgi:hypothetical protein
MMKEYKTISGLTTAYIKEIKAAEGSNASFLRQLAGMVLAKKVSYDELEAVNKKLLSEYKESGITTFKNVAALVARMYDKKAINGKSRAYQIDINVVERMAKIKSFKEAQNIRKEGKAKQVKPAKKVKTAETSPAEAVVDVKSAVQSVRDEVLTVASALANETAEDLTEKLYSLTDTLEDIVQHLTITDKNKNSVAVAISHLEKAVQSLDS